MTALVLLLVAAGLLIIIGGSLLAHARAAGPSTPPPGPTSVVVLGYPSLRGGGAHPIQRWRARLTVQTVQATTANEVVFTGGNPTAGRTEASVMAELAAGYGLSEIPDLGVVLEDTSISTWQNVAQTWPLVGGAQSVVLVSDPLHAARARSYWLRQRPDEAGRVLVTGQSSPFDHWWLQVPTAIHELGRAIFDRLRARSRSRAATSR
jgi:uncharacterized SAM-binding protein YcdF (DUF218 family)